MRWTPGIAVRVALARDHESVSGNRIARLGAEARSEASHWRVGMLFAARHGISLDIAFWVPVADLVCVCG